ncbi:MAG: AsmA-like C-terminal domain-containing protein [Pseudomonadota bacterium]|nr:AsmA-like C-terminal domain-containing protein [Pseudomonadota bacterium]
MRKRSRQFFSKIGALFLLLFFLLLISLPNLIDLDNFRPQLLEYLHSRISGEVALGKLSLTFRHGPGVRVDGLRLFDKSGSQQISVSTAIVNFDFRRLFQRRLHLSRVTLIQPRFSLQVDAGGSPMAGFLRPMVIKNPEIKQDSAKNIPPQFSGSRNGAGTQKASAIFLKTWHFDPDVNQVLVEIIDGSVVFTDCCFAVSPVITHLENLDLHLEGRKAGVPVDFTLDARVIDEKGDGSLNIKGNLSALQWPLKPGEMFLDCQVNAVNLNGGTYFPYYQQYVPMRFIGGRLDIDSTYKGSLMGLFRSGGRLVLHQAELDYQQVFSQKLKFNRFAVDYDFRLADSYNTIETLKCVIDADGLKLKGHCLLYEARRGIDGTIEAGLEILEFDPQAISDLLPWRIMPEKMKSYYESLQKGGRCVVENAYLKGDYRQVVRLGDKDPPTGVMGGRLQAKKLTFRLFDSGPQLAVGSADVALESDFLEISDLDFAWGALEGEAVNLSLRKLYHDPQVKIAGNFDLDFEVLQSSLDSFFQTGSESSYNEPLPVIFSDGLLQGGMTLQGPLLRFSELAWGGFFKGRDLALEFTGLPFAITQGEGSFVLANDRFTIVNATCNLASLPLTLQGSLPGPAAWLDEDDARELDLELAVRCPEFDPEDLDLLLGEEFSLAGTKAGSSFLELSLNADLKHFSDFKLQGTMQLDWRDLELPSLDISFANLNCLADFDQKSIDFKRLFVERGDSDLTFKGSLVNNGEGSGYELNGKIVGEQFFVDDFLSLFNSAAGKDVPSPPVAADTDLEEEIISLEKVIEVKEAHGFPALKVNLEGVVKKLVLPLAQESKKDSDRISPWHYLNDFSFSVSGGLETEVKINQCDWRWGKQESQVSLSGQLQSFTGLHGELEIAVQDLDLDLLLQQTELKSEDSALSQSEEEGKVKAVLLEELVAVVKDDWVENLLSWEKALSRNNLQIKARAQRLRWQQMTIDEIECDCSLDASGVDFKKIAGRSFDGELTVFALWHFADDFFRAEFQLEEINFETFNEYLKNPDRGLPMRGGHGSLNLDLEWQGRSLKSWEKSLNGELDFDFYDGRLKKFTMVSNICSLLNLSQFAALRLPKFSVDQGVPYRTLSGVGIIVDGIMDVEEFALRGSALNLFGDGIISLVEDRVDLDIGVQPLQTVDKLLATIPVVGYIITGDKKTFVVIPMTVQGPFDDIKIKTQTVSGLGQKAGGMIQRFFKTPIRLLQMPGKLLNQIGAESSSETGSGKENSR